MKSRLFVFTLALAFDISHAATFVWNGSGTDANWSTAANWIGGVVPSNDGKAAIVLAGSNSLSPQVDTAWSISSLTYSNNAGAFVLGGNGLTLVAGGITNNSTNAQIVNNAITLATNQTWSASSNILTFNGNINNGTNRLTVAGNFNSFITGVISGTGGLTKSGNGTNFLSGANTYSGLTTVSAGMLNLQNSSALGSPGASATVASGATLALQGGITVTNQGLLISGAGTSSLGALRSLTNNNEWDGPITLAAATTIGCVTNSLILGAGGIVVSNFLATFTGGGNITANGSIGNGTNGLTKSGTGTLTLTAANSYGGATTVSAGVLNIQNSSALPGTGTTVSSGAQLQLQGGITVAGEPLKLSGSGIAYSGALRNIGGSNSWSGNITLGAATTIDADAGLLDLQGNLVNSTYSTTFTNNGTILVNGALGGGSGALIKIGSGVLQLGGANTYTGATTVSGGTLQFIASGSASSATPVTVNVAGTLDLNGFNESPLSLAGAGRVTLGNGILTVNSIANTTFSGVLSGTGSLAKGGSGTLTLSGTNTYSGGTTINAGIISIPADTGLGNAGGSLTLNGGELATTATLASARSITLGTSGGIISAGGTTLTLSGGISGPGSLTKIGTKTLALTGTNTYLGGTIDGAGTISLGSDAALGDPGGPLTFSNGATLITSASFTSARNLFLNAGTATLNIGTGFTNVFSGVINGAGGLTKSGTGLLALGGNNLYTNTTTISAGTLQLAGNGGVPPLSPLVITKASAVFDLNNNNATVGSLASTAAGKVTLENGSLTAGGDNATTTNSAIISGTGSFTKMGTGTMVFTGVNTYTGTTTAGAGIVQLNASSLFASASPLVVSNGAVFNLNNFNQSVASLSGAGSVILGSGTLKDLNSGTADFSGAISGAGAFTLAGKGTQVLSGANSYSGATTVSLGNLQVNGSSPNSTVAISSGATLSGSGTVGPVTDSAGSTNAPGSNGPGTLTSGSQVWTAGANYVWAINNPAGSAGGSPGWDCLNIAGTLAFNPTGGTNFTIKVVSLTAVNATGLLTNFDNTATYIWTIASASGGITGFAPGNFNIDTSAFQNSLGAGAFALSQSGNNLNLIFTTAPLAVIKEVQSGTLTSSGNGTNTVTLGTTVNPTNAFLIFNTRHNSSVPGGSMIAGWLASSNTVEFARATTETSDMNIQWYVVEYLQGVRVQSGQVNQTNTIINVPLSPISAVNQAFITWSKTPDPAETSFSDSDPVVGQITSTTNLQFRVGAAPSSVPVISWQVIEFQNPASISVQTGSVTNLTGTNLAATATLPLPVNLNSTFVLAGYRTSDSGTSIGARMLRAQLTDPATILFDRSISGAPDDIPEIFWQAVQLNDGSTVQSGTVNFTNGIAETNVTLESLNTNRAVAFASVQPAGGQNTGRSPSVDNVLGVGSATLALTSTTELTLDRNNTSDQTDVGWFVVGFGPGTSLTPASGGTAISADTTAGAYTSLTGPVYTEIESGDVGVGTIVLEAPPGFVFNTNAPPPAVVITSAVSGSSSQNINGVASGTSVPMTMVNPSNLVFTVTSASSGGMTCSLTWTNLSVMPSAGTPLAAGNLLSSGTSYIQGVTTNSTSWGYLAEVVGAAAQLGIATQPSAAVTAGVEFPQQPVVQIEDQFGNLLTTDNSDVITATSSGTDTNNVDESMTVVGGVAAFAAMSYQVAQTNTISFTAPGLPANTSSNIVVNAAAASQVAIVTQPSATATAGVPFAQQPTIQVQDQFGNLCATDNATPVTASLDQGSGSLYGTQTFTDVNGVVTFTNLSYQVAETITIDFTAGGLAPATSTGIAVGAAPASQLVIQTQPATVATAGVPFAQQPSLLLEDSFGNLCAANNSTVVTASYNTGNVTGNLQGMVNVTAVNGVVMFGNLAADVAETISIDFNSGGLPGVTSSAISVIPGNAAQLAFSTQPGSATVGSVFGIQPVVVTQDAYGNNSVSGLAVSVPVTLTLTSGTGVLQGTTSLDIGSAAGNGTVAFSNLEIDSGGAKQLTAGAAGLASAASQSFNVAQLGQTVTFGPLTNVTYGIAPFGLSASASSGLPVTFSIVSGPAGITGSDLTVLGAGTVTVSASQEGNSNYLAATPVNQSFQVMPAGLTVTASHTNRTYGATNPVFTASYSGFVNGDDTNVLTGALSYRCVDSNGVSVDTNAPAGQYPIQPLGGLSAANYTFSYAAGVLTVNPAVLVVSADNQSRVYGTTNPVLTATITGFVNGQNLTNSDVVGVPALSTAADTNSPVGSYVITNHLGSLASTNYTFNLTNGVLTITPAGSTNSVSSSSNPALPGSNVVFTATIVGVPAGSDTPSGTVQFKSDGSPLGGPAVLSGGVASVATASLSHGDHVITAEYPGDGNFTGSTNNLAPDQLINTPPTTQLATYPHPAGYDWDIRIANLATNWSDADGDTLALSSVASTSANGVSLTADNNFIYYNSTNSTNPDSFTYVISDTYGATATGTVNLTPAAPVSSSPPALNLIQDNDGVMTITFAGIPGRTYYIQASTDLVNWTTISTNVAGNNGLWQFSDPGTAGLPSRYYRSSAFP